MKCIDEPFEMFGDFDTNIANNLMISFTECDPTLRYCKSREEIDKWLAFKYIIIAEN